MRIRNANANIDRQFIIGFRFCFYVNDDDLISCRSDFIARNLLMKGKVEGDARIETEVFVL